MRTIFVSLVVLGALVPQLQADEPAFPSKFYRLDFVVQELDGTKVVNSRAYSTNAATNSGKSSIRTNTSVLIAMPNLTTSYQSYEIGVNIDALGLRETNGGLALTVNAVVDSVSQEPVNIPNAMARPLTRKLSWNSTQVIPLKKAVVISSSDDLTSQHKVQLVLTATPIP